MAQDSWAMIKKLLRGRIVGSTGLECEEGPKKAFGLPTIKQTNKQTNKHINTPIKTNAYGLHPTPTALRCPGHRHCLLSVYWLVTLQTHNRNKRQLSPTNGNRWFSFVFNKCLEQILLKAHENHCQPMTTNGRPMVGNGW